MRAVVLSVVLMLASSACAVSGLQFAQDERIRFQAPSYREKLTLPITVQWTVSDFKVTGPTQTSEPDAGYFGVLVDVDAVPVGERLSYYARDDKGCRPQSGCPDKQYLAERRIYTTTKTSFSINQLIPAPGVDLENGDRDLHEVTIMLLDGSGRRTSEATWTQIFELIR